MMPMSSENKKVHYCHYGNFLMRKSKSYLLLELLGIQDIQIYFQLRTDHVCIRRSQKKKSLFNPYVRFKMIS